jgi:hypothetical protein
MHLVSHPPESRVGWVWREEAPLVADHIEQVAVEVLRPAAHQDLHVQNHHRRQRHACARHGSQPSWEPI